MAKGRSCREAPSPFSRSRQNGWHSYASRISSRVGLAFRGGIPAASKSSLEGGSAAASENVKSWESSWTRW
eukprot:2271490-Prymnesium_polylepis.1